jgi:hypothetical protein
MDTSAAIFFSDYQGKLQSARFFLGRKDEPDASTDKKIESATARPRLLLDTVRLSLEERVQQAVDWITAHRHQGQR